MTATIEHLIAQRRYCKDYLQTIMQENHETPPTLYRILMDKRTGSVHRTQNDYNYERCCYLIGSYHSSSNKSTPHEKAALLFTMLHQFNLCAYELNNDWERGIW